MFKEVIHKLRKAISKAVAVGVVVIVVIAIIGVVAYLATRPTPTTSPTTPTTPTTSPTTPTTSPTSPTTSPTTPTSPTTLTTPTTPTTTTTSPTTPTKPVVLRVLTRHPQDIRDKAREAFLASEIAKEYNIVDVEIVYLPSGFWKGYIESGKPDVAWGGGPTLFDYLYTEGLLAPLTSDFVLSAVKDIPDVVAGVPMKRVSPDGKIYWVAAAIASFGFTVNHQRLEEYGLDIPKSWIDLATPEMGRTLVEFGEPSLGIADPTASTSNTRMYEIILQRYGWVEGWKILTLMAANARIYEGSSEVRDAVIRGEIAVGITIDFYGYTAELTNPSCEYIAPEGDTIVNGDPIALLKTSQNPEAAQAFIAWVLTEGQKIWLDPNINRLPANPKVFETPEGQKRPDLKEAFEKALELKAMNFNDTLALMYETAMQYYFKATLVDVNDRLKEVWIAILSKYFAGEISEDELEYFINKLGDTLTFVDPETRETVKFTQEYAISINEKITKDAAFRDEMTHIWKNAAIEKYDAILEELS